MDKAVEITNEVGKTTGKEGGAIATGLKKTRLHFKKAVEEKKTKE